ncbi:MAG: hypothetical protein ACLRXQ_08045 [Phascolarctobacterium faecium]
MGGGEGLLPMESIVALSTVIYTAFENNCVAGHNEILQHCLKFLKKYH